MVAECNGYFEELTKALESDCFADIHALLLRPLTQKVGGGKKPADSHRFNTLWELADAYRKGWSTNAAKFAAFSPEEVAQSAEETAALLTLLHTALTRFHADYRAEKKRREIAEFSDVSRAAYNLLLSPNGSPTALARELAASFDAIYIDEYQDVNTMQDTTFRAISTERNRFMVGDIKQSIYSFRGAQPAIFADYRRRFPPLADAVQKDAPCASVQMANCFRCDAPVIDFSNTVSGFLFDRCRDSIGYTKEDDLVFSKPAPETPSPACRVVLIDREKKDADEQPQSPPLGKEANSELCWIAQEIERLLCEERKADGSRITPDDIAVLTRGAAYAEPLARLLRARGIKVNNTSHKSLFENPEVLCMYSLLATIDNPTRDIHLAAALRSPFFGFTLSDLVRLRNGSDRALSLYEALCEAVETGRVSDQALLARCADFLARLRLYREKAEHLPVDRLLRYLYRETAVLGLCAQGTGGVQRENLNQLYEYARRFEGGGYKGLYAFIRYVDDVLKNNTAMPTVSDERDAVSLITIHHSKGLEFPVCFIAGAASAFNTEDAEVPILLDEAIGCATMLPNAGPFSRAHTFWRSALAMELMRRNLEQEMRVLYVAMTRARERLYITARPQWGVQTPLEQAELRAFADSLFPARTLFPKGRSFLDWILTALATKPSHEECTVEILQESEISTLPDAPAPTANANNFTSENVKENVADVLRQRFAFVYPYQHLTRLPAKLSVSRLSPVVLDVFDTDAASSPANWQTPDAKALLESFDRLPFSVESKQTAADRGTATHEFLQFCDFERAARKGVAWELERLIEEGFLPPEIKDAVRMDELEHFFESDLYHSLAKASDVHRETRFHIFLPAEYFTKDAEFAQKLGGERLPVQGVIDLFFTDADGKLILCDYKTDRLTRDELANPALAAATLGARHGEQLSYYALALQELCGRAPDRVLIYSLPLGRALDVTLPPICASS